MAQMARCHLLALFVDNRPHLALLPQNAKAQIWRVHLRRLPTRLLCTTQQHSSLAITSQTSLHCKMFDHLKASVRSRRHTMKQPRRPESAMPRMRNDEEAMSKQEKLDATMSVFTKIRRTGSLKDVLHPPITRTKPLTFTNLFATTKEDTKMPSVTEGQSPLSLPFDDLS